MTWLRKVAGKLACRLFGHRWRMSQEAPLIAEALDVFTLRDEWRCGRCGATEWRHSAPGPAPNCRCVAKPIGTTFEEADGLMDAMWRHAVLDARRCGINPEAIQREVERLAFEDAGLVDAGWSPREIVEAAAFLDRLSTTGHPSRSEVDSALQSIARATQDQDEPR